MTQPSPFADTDLTIFLDGSCSGSLAKGDSINTLEVIAKEEAGQPETGPVVLDRVLAPLRKVGSES